ncbi:hypothetical protein BJ742DRAFT_854948 [Cladochytrium replicatum]|nr:hypothetical protein BJ742DRAFT_854948 [Cladochytrium replicatum]
MDTGSENGHDELLRRWKHERCPTLAYAVDAASRSGRVEVLDWWKTSGLDFRYTENAEWWMTSGLGLERTSVLSNSQSRLDISTFFGGGRALD